MAEDKKSYTDLIIESIADGIFTVDLDWKITSFNKAAQDITGLVKEEALCGTCREVLRASCCEAQCPLKEAMLSGSPVVNRIVSIIDANGENRSISISAAPIRDSSGRVTGGVETFRDIGSIEKVHEEIAKGYACQDILSVNNEMRKIFEMLPVFADSVSTVLLEGETGTGKELFARAIHNLSPRKAKPFITVNCGALPDTLLESELFGYKAGAFTDAKRDKPGRFALAEGGTIFLDEIGDISPALQVRLLRVLQEKTYDPLGGIKPVQADVRIIVATNKNLESLVRDRQFRDDLYYRLNVIRIVIPPLRERREDIPLLVDHFIERFNKIQGRNISSISEAALSYLTRYEYPGNVRELENIIERAFILCRTSQINQSHLPRLYAHELSDETEISHTGESLKKVEAAFLMNALKRNGWNRAKTASDLGIHKSTLFRKIKSLGLNVPHSRK
ncbi:MAG TPA: PAS domain-containing protein [Deltaproteobacteria bacterium]|nr:PAS domain-containing protein [Deltaproteobacteria bacterium]